MEKKLSQPTTKNSTNFFQVNNIVIATATNIFRCKLDVQNSKLIFICKAAWIHMFLSFLVDGWISSAHLIIGKVDEINWNDCVLFFVCVCVSNIACTTYSTSCVNPLWKVNDCRYVWSLNAWFPLSFNNATSSIFYKPSLLTFNLVLAWPVFVCVCVYFFLLICFRRIPQNPSR